MDRGVHSRVRRSLIRAGVATRESTEDELDERATTLMVAIRSIDTALRPALTPDGRGVDLKPGDLLRRLAEVADAVEGPNGNGP